MAKGKLDEMVGGIIEEFLVQESAKAVLDNAKAKVELEVNCDGETAKCHISYEGNGGGYLYAAYVLLSEMMKNTGIDEIDHFFKIIKAIDDSAKKPDDEEEEEEKEEKEEADENLSAD